MSYDPAKDSLYQTTPAVNNLLKMMEYVGQVFHTMNESNTWGAGVNFQGQTIETNNAKSTHTWWHRVAGAATDEPQFSEFETSILKIPKHLLQHFTFAMRQNLHIRQVLDEGDIPVRGSLGENGEIEEALEDDTQNRDVMEVGWIIEPVEFLCKCMGQMLNHCNQVITEGEYSNYKQLLRGSDGTLFESLSEKAHSVMLITYSGNLQPREGAAHFDKYPQKPLVGSTRFLSAD